jgi:hypothetical protein
MRRAKRFEACQTFCNFMPFLIKRAKPLFKLSNGFPEVRICSHGSGSFRVGTVTLLAAKPFACARIAESIHILALPRSCRKAATASRQ